VPPAGNGPFQVREQKLGTFGQIVTKDWPHPPVLPRQARYLQFASEVSRELLCLLFFAVKTWSYPRVLRRGICIDCNIIEPAWPHPSRGVFQSRHTSTTIVEPPAGRPASQQVVPIS